MNDDCAIEVDSADTGEQSGHEQRHRKRTMSMKRLSKQKMELGRVLYPEATSLPDIPRTRADCPEPIEGKRLCAHLLCKYHLALDVDDRSGAITMSVPFTIGEDHVPEIDLEAMADTCVLDVAERGGMILEDVGAALDLTRERIRQVENAAMAKLRVHLPVIQAHDDLDSDGHTTPTGYAERHSWRGMR